MPRPNLAAIEGIAHVRALQTRLHATFTAGVFCFSLASTAALGQGLSAGRIVGNIDGIAVDAGGRPARLIVKGVEANVLIGVSFPG